MSDYSRDRIAGMRRPTGNRGGFSNQRRRHAPVREMGTQPSFKRQRTALACNSCRSRKSRCDGSRPICTMCVEMGLECVFQQPAKVVGTVPTIGQPAGLEDRLHSIEETLHLLLEDIQQRTTQGSATPGRPVSRNTQNELRVNLELAHGGSTRVIQPDTQGQASSEDTVDGMGAITFTDEPRSGFFGSSSNMALIGHITHAMAKTIGRDAIPYSLQQNGGGGAILSISRPASPALTEQDQDARFQTAVDVYTLPPEAEILNLVRLFFADTGMLFPYIHEGSLLKTFEAAKQNNFTAVRRSWLCLLNMILAFATCISARPDLPAEESAAMSDVFFRRAQTLFGRMAVKATNIEIVQSLLLMTQYLQGTQRSAQTWNLHGLTVRAALELGLHTSSGSSGFSLLENETRKRTWYGCIVVDRTLSMTFGRPPAIPTDYVKTELPLNFDLEALDSSPNEPAEVSDSSTVSFFIATIKLYRILGDIISDQYAQNLGSSSHLSLASMLESTIKLESSLLGWKRELPQFLRLRPWEPAPREPEQDAVFERLSIIITLRYLNARVLLHRQVLVRFLERISGSSVGGDDDLFLCQFGLGSLQACLESATEIIHIIHKVGRTPSMLGAWWFSTYYTFNAALVVFAGILIKTNDGAGRLNTAFRTNDDARTNLYLAVEALQNLGGGARLVRRCRKYLQVLIRVATTSFNGLWQHNGSTFAIDGSDGSKNVDFLEIESSQDADLSPLGLDLGEFLSEANLDFVSELVSNSQNMMDMSTIPGYGG